MVIHLQQENLGLGVADLSLVFCFLLLNSRKITADPSASIGPAVWEQT